jgi:hypothetical protein
MFLKFTLFFNTFKYKELDFDKEKDRFPERGSK